MTNSRAFFFVSSALVYAIAIVVATLTLNAYFAQTWDVRTFIQAAHRFLDGGNPFDLYAQSRAAQTWPYAYPPLHAFVTAIFLWVGNLVPILPDYVWARVPALIADIGVGFALYAVIERKTSDQSLARLAMLVWLFNPVTFYDTAVQGHFESEWIFFVLLAYMWFDKSGNVVLPAIAMAVAVLFKQVAILFAIPMWVSLAMSLRGAVRRSNLRDTLDIAAHIARPIFSIALFSLVTLAVCLPYLLYSNDLVYMNLTYLENVPVQTQSWIVALLALTRPAPDAMTSNFLLLRYQTIVTLLAALAISVFAIRRGVDLYLTAALVAIAFFLTSKKVMGYYYVMLFPFLLAEVLPRRRFDLALFAIVLTAWVSLSPYFASWADPKHIWFYALLGTINSILFILLFILLWRADASAGRMSRLSITTLFISFGLFAGAALAAFLQPIAPPGGSPIRAPIIATGAETTVLAAFGVLVAFMLVVMWALSRKVGNVPRAAWVAVLIFAPLFFVVYYLTKESTLVFELFLKTLGV